MNAKIKSNAVEVDIDRISQLPEDIIVEIISCLTLKQAVATSLISTRWRDLWKLYSGCFDFVDLRDGYRVSPNAIPTTTKNFVDWVNQVLRSHQGAAMKRLRIIFNLRKLPHGEIDNWIELALAKRVPCIELELSISTSYEFPVESHCAFQSLKTLFLSNVNFYGDSLTTLLNNCPNLEELKVIYSVDIHVLTLSSLSLKHLTLLSCNYKDSACIKISAPNLLSFTWNPNKMSKLVLENVPKLKYVKLSDYWLDNIGRHSSQLEELVLDCLKAYPCDNQGNIQVPELCNLKHLTMGYVSLNDLAFGLSVAYLKAAPLVEHFTLELKNSCTVAKLAEELWNITKNHCYKNLKTVKFKGLTARNGDEFIRYLVNHAPLLDKIVIDLCPIIFLGTCDEIVYRQTRRYLEDRDRAIKFSASLPCHVTVV